MWFNGAADGRGLVPGSWWGVEDDGRTSRQMAHSSTGRIASSLRGKGKKGGGATRGWKLKWQQTLRRLKPKHFKASQWLFDPMYNSCQLSETSCTPTMQSEFRFKGHNMIWLSIFTFLLAHIAQASWDRHIWICKDQQVFGFIPSQLRFKFKFLLQNKQLDFILVASCSHQPAFSLTINNKR